MRKFFKICFIAFQLHNTYKIRFIFLGMVQENYERVLEKIASVSGLDRDEVNRKIEAKRAKLSGLISQEGAAQIVASELGVNFDNEKLKLNEILPGMRKVNVSGKIINLFPVRSFRTKKGEDGKVLNFVLADDTSNVKVVLWDTNHIELIEKGEISDGSVVEISNASVRDNEIHLGSFSAIKLGREKFSNLITEKIMRQKKISEFKLSDNAKTRAFVVQSFEPKFFNVCSQCKKKAVQDGAGFSCAEHGSVAPEKRALINIVIDDGTETMRTVVFHDQLSSLGLNDLDNEEKRILQRENILGKEFIFSGVVRKNNYFNNEEFVISSVEEINPDALIAELEKN